jgi:hypothetical protein
VNCDRTPSVAGIRRCREPVAGVGSCAGRPTVEWPVPATSERRLTTPQRRRLDRAFGSRACGKHEGSWGCLQCWERGAGGVAELTRQWTCAPGLDASRVRTSTRLA